MKKILIIGFLLLLNICRSQLKQVTIIGELPQQYGGEYVSFSKPVGEYALVWGNIEDNDNAVLKDGVFNKSLDIKVPGIICIYEKPFNGQISVRFFAEPGDTIFLERKNQEVIFRGKNAPINKMFNDLKISHLEFNEVVFDVLKASNTSKEIISKINDIKNNYYNEYNSFFLKKEITKACLDYTTMLMEHCIDALVLNFAKQERIRKSLESNLKKEEADKLANYFIAKYNVYKKENLRSPFFWSLMLKNAVDLERKAITGNKNVLRYWNKFDNVFAFQLGDFGSIDYLESDEYKENFVGEFLLYKVISEQQKKTTRYEDLVAIYKAFTEKFPSSAYIVPISKSLLNLILNDSTNDQIVSSNITETKIPLGALTLYDGSLKIISNESFAQGDKSFLDVLSEKFPNEDVFVDLWATWCGPCLKQFSHTNDLHVFLESQKIKTLFVSYDKEEDNVKWEKYINDYKLKGYHFLPDKTYQEKFMIPLSQSIPRYFLYRSKFKNLKPIEGYPSEKEKFYKEITRALVTK